MNIYIYYYYEFFFFFFFFQMFTNFSKGKKKINKNYFSKIFQIILY